MAHLHLLEVTHGLDGQLAPDGCGRVPWLQLDEGLGPLLQEVQLSSELLQLLPLILQQEKGLNLRPQAHLSSPR